MSPQAYSQTSHSNTGLHTDSLQTIYTTVQHPSHLPDQDIYSTAHLPIILPDSSVAAAPPPDVRSDESPAYATLSFDTRFNGAAPGVMYKTRSISCDYATVNMIDCR